MSKKLSKSDALIWIDALRSGKYKQGKGSLQPTANTYCCLGVACDLFVDKPHFSKGRLTGGMPSDQPGAPQWLREIYSVDGYDDEEIRFALPLLNDKEGFSFDEIADIIQAVYVERVL